MISLLLSLTITATPAPMSDPLRMSSRDLMKQNSAAVEEHRKITATCTDSLGTTYNSSDAQYPLCLKEFEKEQSKQQPLAPPQGKDKKSSGVKIEF